MIQFDRQTTKILRTIYRAKKGFSYAKLIKKFCVCEESQLSKFTDLIYKLYQEEYIFCNNPREMLSIFEDTDCIMTISRKAVFFSTPKANQFIQEKNWDLAKWLIPTLISIGALLVAIVSLVLQFS